MVSPSFSLCSWIQQNSVHFIHATCFLLQSCLVATEVGARMTTPTWQPRKHAPSECKGGNAQATHFGQWEMVANE
jgi:hypothetical protein